MNMKNIRLGTALGIIIFLFGAGCGMQKHLNVTDDSFENISREYEKMDEKSREALIQKLIDALDNRNELVSEKAVELLTEIGEPAVPFLIKALKIKFNNKITITLGNMGMEADNAVPELIRASSSEGINYNSGNFLESLKLIGLPAVPYIAKDLKQRNSKLRYSMKYLGDEINKEVLGLLCKELKSEYPEDRGNAVVAIGTLHYKTKEILPVLIQSANDVDENVRKSAVRILKEKYANKKELLPEIINGIKDTDTKLEFGRLGPEAKEKVEALMKFLGDKKNLVDEHQKSINALETLEKIGPDAEEAVPLLLQIAQDFERETRLGALKAITAIKPDSQQAVSLLIKFMKDTQEYIDNRMCALKALIKIKPKSKEIITALIQILEPEYEKENKNEDNDNEYGKKDMQEKAMDALGSIGKDAKEAVPVLERIVNKKEETWFKAVSALIKIEPESKEIMPALKGALKDESEDIRENTVPVLAELAAKGNEEALTMLVQCLDDKYWKTSMDASDELKLIYKFNATIQVLIKSLNNNDNKIRVSVAKLLEEMGPRAKEAVPALIKALDDKDHDVRFAVIDALAEMGPDAKEAVPVLVNIVREKNPDISWNAIYALCKIHVVNDEVISTIIAYFENFKINETLWPMTLPLSALSELGEPIAPALIEALNNENRNIRYCSVRTLKELYVYIDTENGVPALIKLLNDKEKEIRSTSACILGKIGMPAKEAVPGLIKALKDDDKNVRINAVYALGQIGPDAKEAESALEDAFDDEFIIKWLAVDALRKINLTSVSELIKATKEKNNDIRIYAIRALGSMGISAKDAVPILYELLREKDKDISLTALQSLMKIKSDVKIVIGNIAKILEDKDEIDRDRMINLLEEIAGKNAKQIIPVLIRSLKDDDTKVRVEAVSALEAMGPQAREAIPALMEALKDDDIRSDAASALEKIGITTEQRDIIEKYIRGNDQDLELYKYIY